jgi:hypothetical protein
MEDDGDFDSFGALDMKLYPNPAKGGNVLHLEIPSEEALTASLKITDMLGKIVVDREISLQEESLNTLQVSTANLEKGYYLVVLTTGEERISKPLVIN